MVELDGFKTRVNGYAQPLEEVRESLDLENKEQRVEELEREMEAPGLWDNAERSKKMMKELSTLKRLRISGSRPFFQENMTNAALS